MQSFTWPAILRGLSMVGVAPPRRGGKTFAYLLPLINELLQTDNYKEVPAGSGVSGATCLASRGHMTGPRALARIHSYDVIVVFLADAWVEHF